ncbi:hypothetical protein PRIPAC_92940 [Pristionchus pacificus]|uniref:ShK domain-containing protein n=1 Tax=Pristionchus pacificus TaxID=54126 RepID=A0A2A6CDP2_PRIPA|nr:hypothetical protein PRIPAC_92940 [Pristionchus pacificus]|eukprot:PDM76332.1 ShK domain-containing protein [Pristionchus pacificus]
MNTLISTTILLALIAQAAAQCSTTQNANCANWVKNGFCNNNGYSLAQKQSYCGQSCGLCSASGQPIAPGGCTDGNANCANWVKNGFCTNSFYTEAQRKQYCCQSCGLGSATTAGTTTTGGSTTTAASTTTTTP